MTCFVSKLQNNWTPKDLSKSSSVLHYANSKVENSRTIGLSKNLLKSSSGKKMAAGIMRSSAHGLVWFVVFIVVWFGLYFS